MQGAPLVGWLVTAVCAGTGVYCLTRLRAGPGGRHRQTSGVEGVMGLGMAAMALPVADVPVTVLVAVFVMTAAWSLALLRTRTPHQGHHLLESGAMVYMALAMGGGHHGSADAGHPAVTTALLGYFAVYVLHCARSLVPTGGVPVGIGPAGPTGAAGPLGSDLPADSAAPGQAASPEIAAACRLTLAMGMFTMMLIH